MKDINLSISTATEDDLDDQLIYDRIKLENTISAFNGRNNEAICIERKFHSSALFEIELFTKEVINTADAAFTIQSSVGGIERIFRSNLSRHLSSLDNWIDEYDSAGHFSNHVELFFSSAIKTGLIKNGESVCDFSGMLKLKIFEELKFCALNFNFLISTIRETASSKEFQRRISSGVQNLTRNLRSCNNYVDGLFTRYARLLVLRVDLSFRTSEPGIRPDISMEEAQKYLNVFLNNRRGNSAFSNVVGYIWKLEEGEHKGYHFHIFFFLDGSKAHKDEHRAMLIGKVWEQVTDKRGVFHSSNLQKSRFQHSGIGIGMISHFDEEMRGHLSRIMQYFFKKDQYLRKRFGFKSRTFGRGEMSKSHSSNLGRPRRT